MLGCALGLALGRREVSEVLLSFFMDEDLLLVLLNDLIVRCCLLKRGIKRISRLEVYMYTNNAQINSTVMLNVHITINVKNRAS